MPFMNCRICGDHHWESPLRAERDVGVCHNCLSSLPGALTGGVSPVKKAGRRVGMLRFYRQFVEQTYLMMLYVRDRGTNWKETLRFIREYWTRYDPNMMRYHTQESVDLVNTILENHEGEDWDSLDKVIEDLQKSLMQKEGEVRDKTLIDLIVETLKLPFSQNVLSGNTLSQLKKAILVPDELAGLQDALSRREFHCSNCGHKFIHGEMVSIYAASGGRGLTQLYCTNCHMPSSAPCQHCKTTKVFSKHMMKALGRIHQCEVCEDAIKRGIPIVPADQQQQEEGGRVELNLDPFGLRPPQSARMRAVPATEYRVAGVQATTGLGDTSNNAPDNPWNQIRIEPRPTVRGLWEPGPTAGSPDPQMIQFRGEVTAEPPERDRHGRPMFIPAPPPTRISSTMTADEAAEIIERNRRLDEALRQMARASVDPFSVTPVGDPIAESERREVDEPNS